MIPWDKYIFKEKVHFGIDSNHASSQKESSPFSESLFFIDFLLDTLVLLLKRSQAHANKVLDAAIFPFNDSFFSLQVRLKPAHEFLALLT